MINCFTFIKKLIPSSIKNMIKEILSKQNEELLQELNKTKDKLNYLHNYHNEREMNLIPGRLDFFVTALAITGYYNVSDNYNNLDLEGKK